MSRKVSVVACWLCVAACSVLCLASCGVGNDQTTCTTPSSTAQHIQAGDDQNGQSMTLHLGQTLTVTLCSTYWSFQGSSNPRVLALVGEAVVSPAPQSVCPVAGTGCGTVVQKFRAVGPGTAQVTASRVSCGEAMRCGGAAGSYKLAVTVVLGFPSG